ncbi:MAG: maleylpyruvate isomerase family mycothiol-dependent enzyme [Nocardioidaceae bacterium]|nr:maleylpyruvate isomerase family mycothiol-dependent enzyme [Nocardioidaceae bacterium]NUS52526.1 maleylpyruvate isomerase family mycothiol-dependent enzyme [Nocardioidaceae bacterium]
MSTSTTLPLIDETRVATTRYLAALTGLDDESVRLPSVLPGWSRAHVVAHLSRNADAFTRVLRAASAGETAAMYPSNDVRNAEIDDTVATHDLAGLLDDARESCERLDAALRENDADPESPYARLDGERPSFPLATLGSRRRAEVVIHHTDLDLDLRAADWPPGFSEEMVRQRQDEMALAHDGGVSMVLSSTDVPGLWKFGEGQGPEVHGAVGDLAYWLVGRGDGAGLTCSPGDLPVLGRWR